MATQEIVWNWNNFRGGLSDNPYLGQEGQFQDGINVDVQTEPNGFKLTAPLVQQISNVSTNPSVIIDTSDYGLTGTYADIFVFTQFFGDTGTQSKIYKGTSATPYYTDATGSKIIGATSMWVSGTLAIYYFTQDGKINKLTLGAVPVHSTLSGSFTTGQDKIPLTHYGDDVYFCAGNKFYKLDSITETFSVIYTAGTENTFTGITFFQDSFHLYSKSAGGATSTPRNGRQYIIRVGQTAPDYITKWDRLPIMGACNQGAIDYVVTGFGPNYSDLYVVSGTQRQLVRSNFEGMSLGRKFTGDIISWKDEIFLLGRNKDSLQSTSASSIFRLGKYFPGLPQSLTEIYRAGTGNLLTTLFSSITELYVGYATSGGVYSVQKINLDTPVTEYTIEGGYIVSNVYTAGDATVIKYPKEIEISYMCDNTNPYFPHGGTFKLYARKNPIDSWTQIGSTYTKTDIGRVKIEQNEITSANMGDYTQLELKCTIDRALISTGPDKYASPLITGIKVTSTININD